ncbi:MAG TPA: AI-2E family transporter [Abditibacteriaceae bacterium]|jgi:predicted PurR-regulated permease PerM
MNKTLDAMVARYLGYGLMLLAGAYLLWVVRSTIMLFAVALLFAYALEPALQRLQRRGRPRASAVGFVFLCYLLVLAVGGSLMASAWQQAQGLYANRDTYQQQVISLSERAQTTLENSRLPKDVKASAREAFDDFQKRAPQRIVERGQTFVARVFGSLGSIAIVFIVLPLITLWLMLEMNALRARCLMLVPPIYRRDVIEISQSINLLLGRYVRGQIIVCSLFGACCTVAFSVLSSVYGMGYPLVLGFFAAFIYIVPYLGMATIALSAGLTAYFTSTAPIPCTLMAVGCVVFFNLVIDYGITPRVVGKGVGLHPLMVIFALLSGAQLGGIPGMVLAVPLFASLRVILIYLFPQFTAPIPQTPPETTKTPDAAASEVLKTTADAERAAEPTYS